MNLVFAGTPRFAVPTLDKLVDAGFHVRMVVTQPDRQSGRGMELTASPVKQAALRLGLRVVQPAKIKENPEFRGELSELHPDAVIVVGYGRIIPQWMIELPVLGNLNVHASLLPKYRGAAPIQWAIARGESVTGVTTMRIDAGLDTGDILLQRELPIAEQDTSETLAPKLARLGAELMVETLRGLRKGSVVARRQNHEQATLAPILTKHDGEIDFHRTATEIGNRMRGFQPWPGAFTRFRRKNLHVWSARPVEAVVPTGTIHMAGHLPMVGCAPGTALELTEVQVEGKKRMSAQDFVNGYRPHDGEQLGGATQES
ncbi:MAG TPA: methionyl-tRNA formyltransferase [Terriglobales bacterium]|nr:methionyl-tRNA formyltransferase [Terriglobales bacterium]